VENLGLRLAVLLEFIKDSAVPGFFDLVAVNRRVITFLSCQGNALFFFENTLDFFVIIMSQSIKILA
jgi:hypothetical protein